MNTIITTPEVRLFLRAVRERLEDLTDEEREELVGGLDADMNDLVEERGVDALPEPGDYARELRTAAGFEPEMQPTRVRLGAGLRVSGVLDAAHARWDTLVNDLPGDPWGLLQALRPAWWILRAWVALQMVDLLWGNGNTSLGLSPIPSLEGLGWLLLAVTSFVSIQIGRGKLWPGRPRGGAVGRLLLLAVNLLALACLPVTVDRVATPDSVAAVVSGSDNDVADSYQQGYDEARSQYVRKGMYVDGHWVSNIYPYDASGRPLVGVQLLDQTGAPVSVEPQTECVYDANEAPTDRNRVFYPWTSAAGQVTNVFPVPSRVQGPEAADPDPTAFTGTTNRPSVGRFPLARVQAAHLPGLKVSKSTTPAKALVPGVLPKLPINPIEQGC
jgi:hypothetical protein